MQYTALVQLNKMWTFRRTPYSLDTHFLSPYCTNNEERLHFLTGNHFLIYLSKHRTSTRCCFNIVSMYPTLAKKLTQHWVDVMCLLGSHCGNIEFSKCCLLSSPWSFRHFLSGHVGHWGVKNDLNISFFINVNIIEERYKSWYESFERSRTFTPLIIICRHLSPMTFIFCLGVFLSAWSWRS